MTVSKKMKLIGKLNIIQLAKLRGEFPGWPRYDHHLKHHNSLVNAGVDQMPWIQLDEQLNPGKHDTMKQRSINIEKTSAGCINFD